MSRKWRSVPWTAEEDAIVLLHLPPVAIQILKGRTLYATKHRRWILQHNLTTSNSTGWSAEEDRLVRENYPHCRGVRSILHLFPGRNQTDISTRASRLGIKRQFAGNDDAWMTGHLELLDQIRMRAKQDGIAFCKLDEITGIPRERGRKPSRYFQIHGKSSRKGVHLRRIVRAVEFFGGKLVIDWNDR